MEFNLCVASIFLLRKLRFGAEFDDTVCQEKGVILNFRQIKIAEIKKTRCVFSQARFFWAPPDVLH